MALYQIINNIITAAGALDTILTNEGGPLNNSNELR